jgi:uncharacterized membrane protein
MSDRFASQTKVDRYLDELRRGLRALPADHAQDIVNEIRSHIYDASRLAEEPTTDAGVAAALKRLGSPTALASTYVDSTVSNSTVIDSTYGDSTNAAWNPFAKVVHRSSPLLLVRSALRWVSLSVVGLFGLIAVLAAYGLAAVFALCALAKPFSPDSAGLWKISADHVSLQLGIGDPPTAAGAQELLGWWIIPVGLIVAAFLSWLATKVLLRALRMFNRGRRGLSFGFFGRLTYERIK